MQKKYFKRCKWVFFKTSRGYLWYFGSHNKTDENSKGGHKTEEDFMSFEASWYSWIYIFQGLLSIFLWWKLEELALGCQHREPRSFCWHLRLVLPKRQAKSKKLNLHPLGQYHWVCRGTFCKKLRTNAEGDSTAVQGNGHEKLPHPCFCLLKA